jgi:NTE family protein
VIPRPLRVAALLIAAVLAGCASRPVNPQLEQADPAAGYRAGGHHIRGLAADTLVVVAFSGGGTRAAAFAYGSLEALRDTEFTVGGRKTRMLDEVDIVTGVSGGSFTALAYALYGDRLFTEYEQRFLKRDVQSALVSRVFNPLWWPGLASPTFGRSELAEDYYDEILFEGATFGDLIGSGRPIAVASATDLSTGARFAFVQTNWDLICSDLSKVRLSRAAAASSAVPVILSPVTITNYGGRCRYRDPEWVRAFTTTDTRTRPANRTLQRYKELQALQDSAERPYLHLVDGGVSDNLGMRAVLEGLEQIEASEEFRHTSGIDRIHRIAVLVVNSISAPRRDWDKSEQPPGTIQILVKAAGVPIERYSYEAVELLRDTIFRWQTFRSLRATSAFPSGNNPLLARAVDVPDIELYAIDVSFAALADPVEREYLNSMPTTFSLTPEQVDHLRAAAQTIIRDSPEFKRLVRDMSTESPTPAGKVPAMLQ